MVNSNFYSLISTHNLSSPNHLCALSPYNSRSPFFPHATLQCPWALVFWSAWQKKLERTLGKQLKLIWPNHKLVPNQQNAQVTQLHCRMDTWFNKTPISMTGKFLQYFTQSISLVDPLAPYHYFGRLHS